VKKNVFNLPGFRKNKPVPTDSGDVTLPSLGIQMDKTLTNGKNIVPKQLSVGSGQSIGRQRDHNEDCLFTLSNAIGGETGFDPFGLFIVADGMGGHQSGEVASSTAIRILATIILKQFQASLVDPSTSTADMVQDLMRSAIDEAQKAVKQAAPGSGTTLTAAIVHGQQVTIGHVGDSRAYFINPTGKGAALTRDHSLVKRMEELGQISSEEAATHPQKNVLYRALGQGDVLEADIFTVVLPQDEYLLLCSDGLWNVLPNNDLFRLVLSSTDLPSTCQRLVAAANEAGGPDNISVILVRQSN
jgi:serine/threonine protein phosphatase PrpC